MARVHLEDHLVAKGADLPPTPLPIIDGAGTVVGELTVGVKAIAALATMGKSAHSDQIFVDVTELKLKKAPPAARNGVRLLVDMLGVVELEETTSKATAHGEGLYALPFSKSFTLAPLSKLAVKLATALEASDEEESEIQLVVETLDRSGSASTYGICHVSLKALLAAGQDLSPMAPRPVLSPNGKETLGTLSCSVVALAALRTLKESTGGGAPGSVSLKLSVHEVLLARPPKPIAPLVIHLDLLGVVSSTSAALTPKAGEAVPANFEASFALEPGTAPREAAIKAFAPKKTPADSEVVFTLRAASGGSGGGGAPSAEKPKDKDKGVVHDFSSDDPPPSLFDSDVFGEGGAPAPAPAPAPASAGGSADGPVIATARLSLATLLSSGAELKKTRVALRAGDGSSRSASEAGALFVSTQCLAGLRALTAEAVRTVAISTLTVAIKSITISSKAVLTSVGGAAAASTGRRAAAAGSGTLHILIDMIGVASLEVKTEPITIESKDGTSTALALEQTYDVAGGTDLRTAIVRALKTSEPEDSEVQFAAVVTDKEGVSKEVGLGGASAPDGICCRLSASLIASLRSSDCLLECLIECLLDCLLECLLDCLPEVV